MVHSNQVFSLILSDKTPGALVKELIGTLMISCKSIIARRNFRQSLIKQNDRKHQCGVRGSQDLYSHVISDVYTQQRFTGDQSTVALIASL